MTTNFKPQKGKAFDKLPQKTLITFDNTEYIVSKKYDGNQIFIVKDNNIVRFFTSDWHEFELEVLADDLLNNAADFILIGEFNYGCKGMLGDRPKSAILTTLRTNFKKGLRNNIDETKINIKVFDCLEIVKGKPKVNEFYIDRLHFAKDSIYMGDTCSAINYAIMSGKHAVDIAKQWVKRGYEGAMCVTPYSTYLVGKRVNYSIKLKYRKTADLLCIGVEEGEGKYAGMIGSLVLQDSQGRVVRVGSGLSDDDRNTNDFYYIGNIIEIEYEQLMATYIQPTYIRVRSDKTKMEID